MAETTSPIPWAGVAIVRERQLLTLKERDKPFYILPGGKVEPGETDEEAAIRELDEETRLSAHNLTHFVTINENSRTTGQPIRFRVFTAELDKGPETSDLPARTETIAWIDSAHKKIGIEVGNLLIKLIPVLVDKDLIN